MKDTSREGGGNFRLGGCAAPTPTSIQSPLSFSEGKNDARITNFHIDSAFGRRRRRRAAALIPQPWARILLLAAPLIISSFSESTTPFSAAGRAVRGAHQPRSIPRARAANAEQRGAVASSSNSRFVLKDWPSRVGHGRGRSGTSSVFECSHCPLLRGRRRRWQRRGGRRRLRNYDLPPAEKLRASAPHSFSSLTARISTEGGCEVPSARPRSKIQFPNTSLFGRGKTISGLKRGRSEIRG